MTVYKDVDGRPLPQTVKLGPKAYARLDKIEGVEPSAVSGRLLVILSSGATLEVQEKAAEEKILRYINKLTAEEYEKFLGGTIK